MIKMLVLENDKQTLKSLKSVGNEEDLIGNEIRVLNGNKNAITENIETLVSQCKYLNIKPIYERAQKILIKEEQGMLLLKYSDIYYIEKQNRKSVIYCKKDFYEVSLGLNVLEKKLESTSLIRAHRSFIVNFSHIKRVRPYSKESYTVEFDDISSTALIKRRLFNKIQEILL